MLARLLAACLLCAAGSALAVPDVRLEVDTGTRTLTVFQDDAPVVRFENISIGRGGAAPDRRHQDHRTPLGQFRIARVKHDSDYHLFLGFDYPTREHADRALQHGWITSEQHQEIIEAVRENRLPPQDTPLGGYIGIHGIGNGELAIHEQFNWTEGCIALTNEQVDRLARWVRLGTPVMVR